MILSCSLLYSLAQQLMQFQMVYVMVIPTWLLWISALMIVADVWGCNSALWLWILKVSIMPSNSQLLPTPHHGLLAGQTPSGFCKQTTVTSYIIYIVVLPDHSSRLICRNNPKHMLLCRNCVWCQTLSMPLLQLGNVECSNTDSLYTVICIAAVFPREPMLKW